MAKVAWNFTLQSTSTLQNHQIKMQLKYSVLQYIYKKEIKTNKCQWPVSPVQVQDT